MNKLRVNGEMLMLARQREGLTQTNLAEVSGVSAATISRVESGLIADLPLESAQRLAEATGVTVRFFDRDPAVRHLGFHRLYRLQRKIGARALEAIESELNARRLHILQLLKKFDMQPGLRLPTRQDLDGFSPVQAAHEIRRLWMVKRGVIGPITPLLEAAGILIVEVDLPERAFEGLAVHAFDAYPMIFVRKNQTADRRRYTLAHELAHLLLHPTSVEDQEDEAEAFSAEFLMPEDVARSLLSNFDVRRALDLKASHQLSVQFYIMRASQLGLISKDEKTRLFKFISAKGWRTEEPLSAEPERPTLLPQLMRALTEQLAYTVEEFAGELGEVPDRVRSYFFSSPATPRLKLV